MLTQSTPEQRFQARQSILTGVDERRARYHLMLDALLDARFSRHEKAYGTRQAAVTEDEEMRQLFEILKAL